MLRRFAAASIVASVAIAIGSGVLVLVLGVIPSRAYPLLAVWCILPTAWGVWAAICPSGWVPRRLPLWGMLFGCPAAVIALFVLRLPDRFLGLTLPDPARFAGVLAATGFYYALWTIISRAYVALGPRTPN
jgi:hypothetical protein